MTEISRSQFAVAAVLVVVVVLLGSHALKTSGHASATPSVASAYAAQDAATVSSGEAAAVPASPAADPAATEGTTGADGFVYVHVAGRVRRPGLYKLRSGKRIADAVKRAGGRAHGADIDAINLAAKLTDGEQVLVPRRAGLPGATGAAPAGADAAAGGPAAIISLNSATEEQLETIDGVGPATAAKILAFRQQNGGFHSVDDLAQISGIGPKRLEAMRPHVSV